MNRRPRAVGLQYAVKKYRYRTKCTVCPTNPTVGRAVSNCPACLPAHYVPGKIRRFVDTAAFEVNLAGVLERFAVSAVALSVLVSATLVEIARGSRVGALQSKRKTSTDSKLTN